jgi:hypothetical protein
MEASRNLKVNLKLEGQTCIACKTALKLADDASICTACEANHHARCWTSYGGCATKGCVNAPLRRMDAPVYATPAAPPPLPPGMVHCRSCRNVIRDFDPMCPYCRVIITAPTASTTGPRPTRRARCSRWCFGIIGLLICGVVFRTAGHLRSSSAKRDRDEPDVAAAVTPPPAWCWASWIWSRS